MSTTPVPAGSPIGAKRTVRRFHQARATLILLALSTAALTFTAAQVLGNQNGTVRFEGHRQRSVLERALRPDRKEGHRGAAERSGT